jgi:hypothetical protein
MIGSLEDLGAPSNNDGGFLKCRHRPPERLVNGQSAILSWQTLRLRIHDESSAFTGRINHFGR